MSTTPYHPDIIEYDSNANEFVVGMYELQESARLGGYCGFRITDGALNRTWAHPTEYGVLDFKILPNGYLLAACSDAKIRILNRARHDFESEADSKSSAHEIDDDDDTAHETSSVTTNMSRLHLIEEVNVSEYQEHKGVAMSVDFYANMGATITTAGELSIFNINHHQGYPGALRPDSTYDSTMSQDTTSRQPIIDFTSTIKVQAHDDMFESWVVGVGADCIATGSDDCNMSLFTHDGQLITSVKRKHEMGVTSFMFEAEHYLYSGSYDEHVRKWDLRMLNKPVHTVKTNGGVWRLKRTRDRKVMIASCYGGAEVWDEELTTRLRTFDQHQSIVYGIACDERDQIVSCSFYDNTLLVWPEM